MCDALLTKKVPCHTETTRRGPPQMRAGQPPICGEHVDVSSLRFGLKADSCLPVGIYQEEGRLAKFKRQALMMPASHQSARQVEAPISLPRRPLIRILLTMRRSLKRGVFAELKGSSENFVQNEAGFLVDKASGRLNVLPRRVPSSCPPAETQKLPSRSPFYAEKRTRARVKSRLKEKVACQRQTSHKAPPICRNFHFRYHKEILPCRYAVRPALPTGISYQHQQPKI